MQSKIEKTVDLEQKTHLFDVLKKRFEKHMFRHTQLEWHNVAEKLERYPEKLWSLFQMEASEGEPDVVGQDEMSGEFLFIDCSAESPKGRRSLCYDRAALEARKEFKPINSVVDLAKEMGVELLDEKLYRYLQTYGKFDTKTSSWLKTPEDIRQFGGAIFGDYRYGNVFIYHNGAESYYAARGFRAMLRI